MGDTELLIDLYLASEIMFIVNTRNYSLSDKKIKDYD